jgi:hypothetical protein
MRYLLMVCDDPALEVPEEEVETFWKECAAWGEEMTARGIKLGGQRLRPAETAKSVRVRAGKKHVTDGPFAETKEIIAGFDILKCASMDEAIEVAAAHPVARYGVLEIRAYWEGSELTP